MRLLKNIFQIFRTHEPCLPTNSLSVPRRGVARDLSRAIQAGGLALFCIALSACSDKAVDEPDGNNEANSASSFFLTLNVNMPTKAGTRDYTTEEGNSSDGIDDDKRLNGTTAETSLNSATIYFCSGNEVYFDFEADYIEPVSTGGNSQLRVELTEDIETIAKALAGKRVQLFVAGNTKNGSTNIYTPSIPTGTSGKGDISKATFDVSSVTDFGDAGKILPLVNADVFEVDFPGNVSDSDADKIQAVKGLFDRFTATIAWWDVEGEDANGDEINQLTLERGLARLEYKDLTRDSGTAPEDSKDNKYLDAYKYWVGDLSFQIELKEMTPFNVNTGSYLFRHTAAGTAEKATTEADIFGIEKGKGSGYNWIANPDWTFGTGAFTKTGSFLNTITVSKDAYSIDGTSGHSTIDAIKSRTNGSNDGYHPWCYVTENTLPSTSLMADYIVETNQQNGQETKTPLVTDYATGVAFKFLIYGSDGRPLIYSEDEEDSNYPEEITNSITPEMPEDGEWITIMDPATGLWVDIKPDEEDGKYYLTYIACIVHNDDSSYDPKEEDFAPMFYGVVRNNTYQMTVRAINGLPLPQDPRTLYLQMDVKILPWGVRQNVYDF